MQSTIVKWHYPSGALYAEIEPHYHLYFYENGQIKTKEPYKNGLLDGEVLLYWPDGSLKRRSLFKEGKREGLDQIWDAKGTLVDEGRYEKAQAVGVHQRWNPQGKLIEKIDYSSNGTFFLQRWNDEGILSQESGWKKGVYWERKWDPIQQKWNSLV